MVKLNGRGLKPPALQFGGKFFMERFKKKTPPEERFEHPEGHIRDRIIINQGADMPDKTVFVALNGFPFDIPVGIEVDIPRPVRKMLDTRIKTETVRVDDGHGRVEAHSRHIPRFTYILIKEGVNIPDPEPVEATAGG